MLRAKSTDFLILQKRELGPRERGKCMQKLHKEDIIVPILELAKQEAEELPSIAGAEPPAA